MDKQQMGACIGEYKQKVRKLEEKNAALEAENCELKYILHDIKATNDIMRDDIEQEVAAECGCVIISNSTCYQDFIGILLNNSYTVEVQPIHKGKSLKITIKEYGDE